MHRNNVILLVIALVQTLVLGGFLLFGGADAEETKAGGALVALEATAIREIEISTGPKADALVLKRGEGEDDWVLASAHDYPADGAKVKELLEKVARIDLGRPVIRSADNHGPVKVADDDFGRRLRLKDQAGAEAVVYVAAGSRGRSAYVRRAGEDAVYETEDLETWDLRESVAAWADAAPLKFDAQAIRSLELVMGERTFRFERRAEAAKEDGAPPKEEGETPTEETTRWWLVAPEEAPVKGDAVGQLLDDLAGLRAEAVLGTETPADRGFETPAAKLTLTPAEGEPFTILVGAKAADAGRRAYRDDRVKWYLEVPDWTLGSLLDKTIDDFREPPAADPEAPPPSDGD